MRLKRLQQTFCTALAARHGSREAKAALLLIRAGGRMTTEQRLAIYRRTGLHARLSALQAIFPVCRTILGPRTFDTLARDYAAEYPSRQTDLNKDGEHFAAFAEDVVQRTEALHPFLYLADLARLEWLWHAVYYRPDDPLFDAPLFARQSAHADELVPTLSHSLELMRSDYPVHRIWSLHRERHPPARVDGLMQTEYVCIHRRDFEPVVAPISRARHALLQAARDGRSLGDMATEPHLADEIAALPALIERGWIIGFTQQSGIADPHVQ